MVSGAPAATYDRVAERRRAVALARHFREAEGLSIAQIADRLGRSPATVKAYFYDPTGKKARAVKARYVGVCRGCGAYTQPRNGKGDAYTHCKACHPGAIERRWTRERVLDAMLEWRARYGHWPSSYDWSRTHAHRRGGQPIERLSGGDWPSASAVSGIYGSWKAAGRRQRITALRLAMESVDRRIDHRDTWPDVRVQPSSTRREQPIGNLQQRPRFRAGNPIPTKQSQKRVETERSVVSIQVGEKLERRQRRLSAVASVSDGPLGAIVEPVPRIALTQQEACASLGCSEEFFVEHIRPYLRVVRRGRKRLFPIAELRRAVDEMAENVF